MRYFRQVFSEVVEFIPIDGPFEAIEFSPEMKNLVPEGQAKHFSWLKFWNTTSEEEQKTADKNTAFAIEETVKYLIKVI